MTEYETIEYRGHNINIYYDEDPQNPRTEWDNRGTMICFHSRYNLGDEHNFSDPRDFLVSLLNEFQQVTNCFINISIEDYKINKLLKMVQAAGIIILPLYLYDHSGITMSTNRSYPFNCPWDSGQVGWIYITPEKIREEYSVKRISKKLKERIISYLEDEVKTYDQHLTGEVFGYNIDEGNGEIDASCWGFYGTDSIKDILEDYAKPAIDHYLEKRKKTKQEKVKALIRKQVPLFNRQQIINSL